MFNNCKFTNDNFIIPPTVTSIGAGAFMNNMFTGNLVMANVESLGNQAFRGNVNLRSIVVDSPVLDMSGYQVFAGCKGLEYIDIPKNTSVTGVTSLLRTPSVTTTGAAFSGLPAHTVVYLPSTTPVTPDASTPNYVLDDKCEWFYIQDGVDYYIPHTFTATKATWNVAGTGAETTPTATRTVSGYATAYLPYDFTPSGVKAYALGYKNNHKPDNAMDNTFVFNQVTSCAANTPYVIDGASGTLFSEASSVSVPKTPISRVMYTANGTATYDGSVNAKLNPNCTTTIDDPVSGTWGFYGTTEAMTPDLRADSNWEIWTNPWRVYVLSANEWHPFDVNATIPPLRAFLIGDDVPVGSKPNFTFVNLDGTEDTTNSIDGLNVVNAGVTHIYNVNGQYLGTDFNALPKGLYIVNGKKQIKK